MILQENNSRVCVKTPTRWLTFPTMDWIATTITSSVKWCPATQQPTSQQSKMKSPHDPLSMPAIMEVVWGHQCGWGPSNSTLSTSMDWLATTLTSSIGWCPTTWQPTIQKLKKKYTCNPLLMPAIIEVVWGHQCGWGPSNGTLYATLDWLTATITSSIGWYYPATWQPTSHNSKMKYPCNSLSMSTIMEVVWGHQCG